MNIFALHGFLGLPSDFDQVQKHFQSLQSEGSQDTQGPEVVWHSVDYLKTRELSAENSLIQWGENFNLWVQSKLQKSANSQAPEAPRWLVGYSQGGRLALHALKQNPQIWAGAVLISTGLGLPELEKRDRRLSDQQWATSFLNEPFDQTVARWNSQTVFKGSTALEPKREESQFNRRQLAQCLTEWSVAQQNSFFPFLKSTTSDLLYLVGDKDPKYVELAHSIARQAPQITTIEIANAGHRLMFDQPEQVAQQIRKHIFKSKKKKS